MTSEEKKSVAAVVGVGAGLGAALSRRFAGQYAVALMARDEGSSSNSLENSRRPAVERSPS